MLVWKNVRVRKYTHWPGIEAHIGDKVQIARGLPSHWIYLSLGPIIATSHQLSEKHVHQV